MAINSLRIEPTLVQFGTFANQIHHPYLQSVLICGYLLEGADVHYASSRELVCLEFAFEFQQTIVVLFEAGFAGYYNFHVYGD